MKKIAIIRREKQEEKQGRGTLCIQQPALVGYNNSTITEKLQALF
jgi:hypothetical protein